MSKHPIPDWLRSQFSRIEDEVHKLGPCGVFTQMRTVTQTYFEQAAAPQPPALGGEAGAIIGSLERFESDGEDFVKLHDVRDVVQVVIAPLQAEITGFKKERSFLVARNDELHTRNAELEGLLLLIRDQPSLNPVHRARIKSALSKPAGSKSV